MYKMSEEMKEEITSCDYYSMFIKCAVRDLKANGICYVFNKEQADEIKKYIKVPINVNPNDCGFTLSIERK